MSDRNIKIEEAITMGQVLKEIARRRWDEETMKKIDLELEILSYRMKQGQYEISEYMVAKIFGNVIKFVRSY